MQSLFHTPGELANPGWVLVALAAGLLGIAVLVLARIRRFQARPLRVCFLLSILAHGLLLAVFYLSRVLDMPYLPGSQFTLVVDLSLDELDGRGEAVSLASPPLPSPPPAAGDSTVAEVEATDPQPDATTTHVPAPDSLATEDSGSPNDDEQDESSLQAPDLLELPQPSTPPASEDAAVAEPAADHADNVLTAETQLAPQQQVAVDDTETTSLTGSDSPQTEFTSADSSADRSRIAALATPTTSAETGDPPATWSSTRDDNHPSPLSQVPRRYRDRLNRPTGEDLKRRGGSPLSERAVDRALQWLARHQSTDGRWDPKLHAAGQGGWIEGQHRGSTGLHADTGITGLALLAFLAGGHTHQAGAYQQTVQDGLDFLISCQSQQGHLGADASIYAQMYCHGIATLALCEALALSRDESLKPTIQRAIAYTAGSQHRATGGWRYRPGDPGDTSQFGWQLMAIVSAREAGLEVPASVDHLMARFLESVQCGASRGLAAYRPGFPPSHSMTAEALACRGFLGWRDEPSNQEAIRYIMTNKPGVGPRNFYYWYYATVALSQLDADQWTDWNHALQSELLKTQRRGGSMAGSWDPTTVWGKVGGRVYTTAMATLCLESYYRYAR